MTSGCNIGKQTKNCTRNTIKTGVNVSDKILKRARVLHAPITIKLGLSYKRARCSAVFERFQVAATAAAAVAAVAAAVSSARRLPIEQAQSG